MRDRPRGELTVAINGQCTCRGIKPDLSNAQVAKYHEGEHEELFVVTHVDSALVVHQSTDLWLIDSGCSNHMSPNLGIFEGLYLSCTSKVRIGNGDMLAAHGKGTAVIQTISGTKQIDNVLYVLEIAHNLVYDSM